NEQGEVQIHFHALFNDNGFLRGGHFDKPGNIIGTTMEIAIQEVEGVSMTRPFDSEINQNHLQPEVVDVNASASLDGDRAVNDVIDIIVTFSDPVTVNTGGGTPRLLLETGMTDKYADYLSGTGTDTLTFRYTVQAEDSFLDLDYKATDSLELNGGTIRDTGDTIDANLTLPVPGNTGSLGFNRDIVFSDLPWYNGAWGYRIKITIDSTKVTGDLSDFPYLIHIASNAGLRDNARADGYDLLFTGDDKVTKLEHEIEEFVSGKESWHMGEDTLLEQQC
ncbi:hypothetical protein LCGC14_2158850, partial [marine sediment metagenome]